MMRVRVGAMADIPWVREYIRRKEKRKLDRILQKEVREQEWKDHIESIL